MPDGREISTMSLGNQDGNPHPRVRRFGGDLFGNKQGEEINESDEDTAVLLSESSAALDFGFLIRSEFLISALKSSVLMAFKLRYVICDSLRYSMAICMDFQTSK